MTTALSIHSNYDNNQETLCDDNLPAPKATIEGMLADRYVHGLYITEIAKKYGISERTAYRYFAHPQVLKKRVQLSGGSIKDRLIADAEDTAVALITSMDKDTIKDMSGLQRLTGFGILVDKTRLLRGEATEIHEHRLDPEYIKLRQAEIVTELQRRGAIETPQDVVV